jgi:YfiH family protein
MTQYIEQWPRPSVVAAVQTTNECSGLTPFDAHPDNQTTQQLQWLADQFALPHPVFFLKQVHGNQVIEYSQPPTGHFRFQADACFTRQTNTVCAIMTADCLPVLLTDETASFVAAVHCGWRSLFAGILDQVLTRVAPDSAVTAWLGPCIQQAQYEVTESFKTNYLRLHPDAGPAFTEVSGGHCQASLTTLAKIQLDKLGVSQVSQDLRCTHDDPGLHSWRRNQTPQRMASLLWLKES